MRTWPCERWPAWAAFEECLPLFAVYTHWPHPDGGLIHLCRAPEVDLRALAANATALKAKRRALAAVIPRLLWRVATPSPAREAFANTEDAFSSVMATLAMRRAHGLRGGQ